MRFFFLSTKFVPDQTCVFLLVVPSLRAEKLRCFLVLPSLRHENLRFFSCLNKFLRLKTVFLVVVYQKILFCFLCTKSSRRLFLFNSLRAQNLRFFLVSLKSYKNLLLRTWLPSLNRQIHVCVFFVYQVFETTGRTRSGLS